MKNRTWQFGIEHEVAFLNTAGRFADFTCTSFEDMQQIVDKLPLYDEDYPQLRIGDAGIKVKRWYVEGYERFDNAGNVIDCVPKGIEIRTSIHPTIDEALKELVISFQLLKKAAKGFGYQPVHVSFNPFHAEFQPIPPLNEYELQRRQTSPEKRTAHIPLLSYGPDLNVSLAGMSGSEAIRIARKLTFYSPFIIPFSFSSPFCKGQIWNGLSFRTFLRTGARPAALVFVEKEDDLVISNPSLTKITRLPAEVNRIEFKACDTCRDFELYGSLLALLKGLIIDTTLDGSALVPDADLHQRCARLGFADPGIKSTAKSLLLAAQAALVNDPDVIRLQKLERILESGMTPADEILAIASDEGSLPDILSKLVY